jgi:hypothetical protein
MNEKQRVVSVLANGKSIRHFVSYTVGSYKFFNYSCNQQNCHIIQ